jgi:hypothetical protein
MSKDTRESTLRLQRGLQNNGITQFEKCQFGVIMSAFY